MKKSRRTGEKRVRGCQYILLKTFDALKKPAEVFKTYVSQLGRPGGRKYDEVWPPG